MQARALSPGQNDIPLALKSLSVGKGFPPHPPDFTFEEIWRVLQRRKWIIFGSAFTLMALALSVSLLLRPKYQAVSIVEIKREMSDMLRGEMTTASAETPTDGLDYTVTLQTQAAVLASDSLIFQVVQQLGLEKRDEFRLAP